MYASHLEAELLAFLRPDETAADLLARTYVEPFVSGVPLLDQHVSLRPGTVLEVAGAAGTGKTEILVQVLPSCNCNPQTGGKLSTCSLPPLGRADSCQLHPASLPQRRALWRQDR